MHINKTNPLDYIPHTREMLWITDIISLKQESAVCTVIPDTGRMPVSSTGNIPVWTGIEFMAQTIAVASTAISEKHQNYRNDGMLVAAKKVKCNCREFIDKEILTVRVSLKAAAGQTSIYNGAVYRGESLLLQGELTVVRR